VTKVAHYKKMIASFKIRRDVVFVSAVLFTVALLVPVPKCLKAAWKSENVSFQHEGFACLTITLVGLLITWTGFIQRIRWAWFVMFIIVWVAAFPHNGTTAFATRVGVNAH